MAAQSSTVTRPDSRLSTPHMPRRSSSRTAMKVVGRIILYAVIIAISLFYFLPFVWMVSTSLKTDPQVYRVPPTWIPNPARFQNYPEALRKLPWDLYFLNTLKYAAGSTLGTVLSSVLCAYGFSRVQWKGREAIFFICLATMMVPFQVRMIPLYLIFNKLQWLNTYKPMIVPTFFGSAYSIFLLRQFFLTIPVELSDAARIDGASELGTLMRIILPLSKPAIAVVALFTLMAAWNDYMGPLIYLKDMTKYPIAMGLQQMRNQSMSAAVDLLWPYLMAASAVTIMPVLILFFFTQRTFVEGISLTGIKG